jgi:uncharacterized Zn-binding protein involved in type VI secretion
MEVNMPEIARLGDTSSHGGKIISASGKATYVNGIQVAVNGDMHQCPIKNHGTTPISSSSTVKSGGNSVIRIGDTAGCGAVISSASPNVNADQ